MNFLRILSILAVVGASVIARGQTVGVGEKSPAPATTQPLQDGRLTVWISTQSNTDPTWESVRAELKSDYPGLQLDWEIFPRNRFFPALDGALSAGKTPDVIFTDNYAQQGPFLKSGRHTVMAGVPRVKDRGWWTIHERAPHRNEAQAFFLWLEQPKAQSLPQARFRLLSESNQNSIAAVALRTIKAFGSLPVQPPSDVLDPQIAPFSWGLVRPMGSLQPEQVSYTPSVESVGGNARLAFVTLFALAQGEQTFGLIHSFLILRRQGPSWKVLFVDPNESAYRAEQLFLKLDTIPLEDEPPMSSADINLLAPREGERISRFPKAELAFKANRDTAKLMAIESEFLAGQQWSPSHIDWVGSLPDATGIVRLQVPFGVGMQPIDGESGASTGRAR